MLQRRYNKLEKQYLAKYGHKDSTSRVLFRSKKNQELEYNKSLLMPYYQQDVVEHIAHRKTTPLINNNLVTKKHKYGENKEKEYKFRLMVVEVMQDVCRINNWTTKKDWKEKGVLVEENFRTLFTASVEYCDILKYYAKLRFDERQSISKGF